MYGGSTFDDLSKHPNQCIPIKSGPNKGKCSTAAGRYQYLYDTWTDLQNRYGFEDFGEKNQDAGALALARENLRAKGMDLDEMLASGRMDEALANSSNIWTSLKGGIEENPKWSGGTPVANALRGDKAMMKTESGEVLSGSPYMTDNPYLDDAQLEAMVRAGIIPAELQVEYAKQKRAQDTIDRAAPSGRKAGDLYQAANPLEHLASGIQKYRANRDLEGIDQGIQDRLGEVAGARKGYAEALRSFYYPGGPQPAGPQPAGPQPMPTGGPQVGTVEQPNVQPAMPSQAPSPYDAGAPGGIGPQTKGNDRKSLTEALRRFMGGGATGGW